MAKGDNHFMFGLLVWRQVQQFLLWVPVAALGFYGAVFGLATQTDNRLAKGWVDGQITMWNALMGAAYFPIWCVALAALWILAYCIATYQIHVFETLGRSVSAEPSTPQPKAAGGPFMNLRGLAPFSTLQPLNPTELLRELYNHDTDAGPKGLIVNHNFDQVVSQVDGRSVTIEYKVVMLYAAHAKLLFAYIPSCGFTVAVCDFIRLNIATYLDVGEGDVGAHGVGHDFKTGSELTFTGKVFIYHEDRLKLAEQGAIDATFTEAGLTLQLRSTDYALATRESIKAIENA